jgi:pimeloyl-ACP methyl ester carboxylesterase
VRSEWEGVDEEILVGRSGRPARFVRAGRGRPVVLLHAVGENRRSWNRVLGRLASRYEVFAPDLPGFDGTGCPQDCSPGSFEGFARDLVDTPGRGPAVVMGSSLGGVAALRPALHSPERVSALCLVGAAGQTHVLIDELPRLGMPTMLVRGERDRVVPVAHGRGAVHRLPHGELAVLPATGHLPHVERPDAFVASVLAFLLAHGPGR